MLTLLLTPAFRLLNIILSYVSDFSDLYLPDISLLSLMSAFWSYLDIVLGYFFGFLYHFPMFQPVYDVMLYMFGTIFLWAIFSIMQFVVGNFVKFFGTVK